MKLKSKYPVHRYIQIFASTDTCNKSSLCVDILDARHGTKPNNQCSWGHRGNVLVRKVAIDSGKPFLLLLYFYSSRFPHSRSKYSTGVFRPVLVSSVLRVANMDHWPYWELILASSPNFFFVLEVSQKDCMGGLLCQVTLDRSRYSSLRGERRYVDCLVIMNKNGYTY